LTYTFAIRSIKLLTYLLNHPRSCGYWMATYC